MNITTSDIISYVTAVNRLYADPLKVKESEQKARHRREVQAQSLLASVSLCPEKDRAEFRRDVADIDAQRLKAELGQQFTNVNVTRATACAITGVFYQLPMSSLTLQESINEYITNPRQIGSESVYGYALLSGYKDADAMFIAKAPRRGSGSDLEHELFVALNGTNRMRDLGIPNFSLVYGGYRCSKTIIDPETKKVVQWCSSNVEGSVPYTLYENISPGMSADEYTKRGTVNQIISMFVQFVFAESIAYDAIGWTHYDAHNENVIMRNGSAVAGGSVFQIRYDLPEGTLFVTADSVATFIDYGMSCIRYGDETIGTTDVATERIMTYGDRPNPLHDVYKFLMFTLLTLSRRKDPQGKKMFAVMSRFVLFFNQSESVMTILNKQWDFRYSLPHTTARTIHDFRRFMLSGLKVLGITGLVSETLRYPALECRQCLTFGGIKREIGAVNSTVVSLIDYYDKKGEGVVEDTGKLMRDHVAALRIILSKGESMRTSVVRESVEALVQQEGVEKMKRDRIRIFELLGVIDRAQLYMKVAQWAVTLSIGRGITDSVKKAMRRLLTLKSKLCSWIAAYKHNFETVTKSEVPFGSWYKSEEVQDVYLIHHELCSEPALHSKAEDEDWFILGTEDVSLYPAKLRSPQASTRGHIV